MKIGSIQKAIVNGTVYEVEVIRIDNVKWNGEEMEEVTCIDFLGREIQIFKDYFI